MTTFTRNLVLIVDDNEAARYVNARVLKDAGFDILETASGERAVELAQRDRPELVLLDIKLPDIDGFEVCRRLRADPRTASMAIVQISATFESAEYQVRGLEGGADTFLVSPIEPTVLVATVRAMLRLRRAEGVLREYDRRKDEFLATVAHELRNPLAPLRYCLDSLESATPPDPALLASCLRIMRRQLRHLIRLVDDLADMSRIAENKLTLRPARVGIERALESAVEALRHELEERRHRLVLDLPEQPIEVEGDPVRLAQVFGNLLSNATKYTPSGGRIEVAARRDGQGFVTVSVTDTGVGIRPEDIDRIFDLFVQVGERGTGLGIGLALVSRIVAMHGGTVAASSPGPGRGSTFTVRLPLAPPRAGRAFPEGAAERQQVPAGSGAPRAAARGAARPRVLVVDDNADAADAMTTLLHALGCEVRACYGGEEALAGARQLRPQAVFIDITMPDLDGFQVIARMRREPWGERAWICTVSGHGPAYRAQALEAGADEHLVKPIGVAELRRALEHAAERRAEDAPRPGDAAG
ncbi:MAG TPA: response regulator [Gammaproteobacteria bacterium]